MLEIPAVAASANEGVTTMAKVSDRIRQRLVDAGKSYRANDNISEFISEGELDALRLEVQDRIEDVLRALVIDTANDHNTVDTARRVAKMYLAEVFAGRYLPAPDVTTFPNVARLDELLVVGPITFRSACSHHLCPIRGKIWIGVLPSARSDLIGLSKYVRLCNWIMSRPQIQEEAIVMLADELERCIKPEGLAITMAAEHSCLHWRGAKDDALMLNSVMRGEFRRNADLRRDFRDMQKLHFDQHHAAER